jgi:hypothetical protein
MTWKEYENHINKKINYSRMLPQTIRARQYIKSLGFKSGDIHVRTPCKRGEYQETKIDFRTTSQDDKRKVYNLRKQIAKGGFDVLIAMDTKTGRITSIWAIETYEDKGKIRIYDFNKKGFLKPKYIKVTDDEVKLAYKNYVRNAIREGKKLKWK